MGAGRQLQLHARRHLAKGHPSHVAESPIPSSSVAIRKANVWTIDHSRGDVGRKHRIIPSGIQPKLDHLVGNYDLQAEKTSLSKNH